MQVKKKGWLAGWLATPVGWLAVQKKAATFQYAQRTRAAFLEVALNHA
jgi:hypothetical protein